MAYADIYNAAIDSLTKSQAATLRRQSWLRPTRSLSATAPTATGTVNFPAWDVEIADPA